MPCHVIHIICGYRQGKPFESQVFEGQHRSDQKMIKVLAIYSGHEFTKFERFFVFIGVVLLSISTLTGLLSYGFSWKLVAPGYHALATLFGILFSYMGVKVAAKLMLTKANDVLSDYWLYRLTAWVTRKAFSGVVFVAAVIFYSWIRQSPPSLLRPRAAQTFFIIKLMLSYGPYY
jgi:hypothetical protein